MKNIGVVSNVGCLGPETEKKYYYDSGDIDVNYMDINKIKTPKDIFDFMSENIKYGWLDVNGKLHVN